MTISLTKRLYIYIYITRDALSTFLELLISRGPDFGLHINRDKCEILWPSGDQEFSRFPPEIRRLDVSSNGAELLGSPLLGSKEYFDVFFKSRVDVVLDAQARLVNLDNPQVSVHLLRSCLSACKINHLLRTVPPGTADSQLARFDHGLRHTLGVITQSSISDTCWLQATLPIRLGGLGFRETLTSSSAAFLGSCHSSRQIIVRLLHQGTASPPPSTLRISGEEVASSCFNNHLGYENNSDNPNPSSNSQKSLQAQIDNKSLSLLRDICSIRGQARLNTISSIHAGAWIKAIPNEKLGLAMQKQDFITSVRIWLGIPIFPSHPNAQRCVCGHVLDTFGDHALSCGSGPTRTKRHDSLRDILWHALLTDNSDVKKEQRTGRQDSSHRPGDIYHPDFINGKPAFFDITVRNSLQPRYVVSSATSAGTAALAGEAEKDERHEEDVVSSGGLFFPLAVETLGYWTPSSLKTLKTIASKTTSCNTTSLSQAFSNLMQQLSVKLWVYNARLVHGCLQLHSCNDSFWDLPT